MARRRTPAQLAASLDRVATKPAGDVAGAELEHDQEDREQDGSRVDVDHCDRRSRPRTWRTACLL
jgi:hypothetical protein